jgi:hypothetical protein
VEYAQSWRDELQIYENGDWFFQRAAVDGIQAVAFSLNGRKSYPTGPIAVEGFRDGAMRLLNSSPFSSGRLGTANETAVGFGEEAEKARARLEAEDAAENQRRRNDLAAIDSFVKGFIREAIQRKTPTQGGVFKK